MQAPNLDRVYGSFFKIEGTEKIFEILAKVSKIIESLKSNKIIGWYAFHIHERKQYDPEPENRQKELGVHFRLELLPGIEKGTLKTALLEHCEKPILGIERDISGITVDSDKNHLVKKEQLKNGNISEAWKVVGEASEWVLHLINSYKPGVLNSSTYNGQIIQHIHFIMNLLKPTYTQLIDGAPLMLVRRGVNGQELF